MVKILWSFVIDEASRELNILSEIKKIHYALP
jgi:hypothetical protein